ncbi:SpoIIE family protein phosphatase [Shewanella sp. 10N.7]|uniref:SpoIIE family protein phosphatase n=1 Tax=Shewanella sp. 10N.7 TaxID=2885093 RepID=UPI001E284A42|nr:SpoIIE family protein phosphatase [Shewanella sp. 10N.7]MCC4834797.1 SpoIIE family protein phosphatase [Shewanella sp. 10N.7]
MQNASAPAKRMSILLVEDTFSERYYIASLIQSFQPEGVEFIITQCEDGLTAFDTCKLHHFDLIISDWRMPNMSGVELCKRLKEANNPAFFLLLTGNDKTEDMVYAMETGADDYITKPFLASVLKVKILAAVRLIQAKKLIIDSKLELESILSQKQTELKQAAALQQSLLPKDNLIFDNWEIQHYFEPAAELAGDIFQCFRISEDWIGFYVIDVSGHGAPSAMLSFTLAQGLSPQRMDWQLPPEILMQRLNLLFDDPANLGQFATVIIGKINTQTHTVQMCSAGHPMPFLLSKLGVNTLEIPSGLPIGIDNNSQYKSAEYQLNSGEQLLLFSDGVYEVSHPLHGMFGLERFKQRCLEAKAMPAHQLLKHLIYVLNLWKQNDPQDDMSLLLFSAP